MGNCISPEPEVDFDGPVDFNHFHILRAIGKGAFGKVCIVKKKDTKQMYAMKYMNKIQIIRKHAVDNVFREIKILRAVDNRFLVNLWFTFQDREDMFMVLDLMLGGDLSYHLEKSGKFLVDRVRLYIAEVSLALEYLHSKRIIHRDIKPANMLLDSQGHVHVTDFNVATVVRSNVPVTSTTGTKPYMAPEVVQPPSRGYRYAVDWWSLGVSSYEMLRGHRPFALEKNMSTSALYSLLTHTRPSASVNWDDDTCDALKMLLHPDDKKRLQSAAAIRKHPFFKGVSWEEVEEKTIVPPFIPPQNRINCDPTHELEEMIVEPNPLHKKRHRLSKRVRSEEDTIEKELDKVDNHFRCYNRQREREQPAEETTKRSIEESSKSVSVSDPELTSEVKDKVAQVVTSEVAQVVVEAEVSPPAADVNGATAVTAEAEGEVQEIAADSSGSAMKEGALTERGGEEVVAAGVESGEVEGGDTTADGAGEGATAGTKDGEDDVVRKGEGTAQGDTGVKEDGDDQGERTISPDKV